jgi:hypothetical protein
MRLLVLSIALTSSFVTAWGQSPAAAHQYRDLSRQIFCCLGTDPNTSPFPPAQKVERAVAQMRELMDQTIMQDVTREEASSSSIARAMAQLQGDELNQYWEQPPFADLSNLNGTRTLVTAFAILSGGVAIPNVYPYIQFYSRATGAWEMHAGIGGDFWGTAFSISPIKSPVPSELWYLVWGKTVGDTGARLRLRLYGFDGFSVRTISRRDDLEGGTVKLSGDRVILEYNEPAPYGGPGSDKLITEILRPTANGLEQ